MLSILKLPFHRRPAFELLGFDLARTQLDLEYTGYGWAEPRQLWLQGDGLQLVEAPLLLALHSADDGPALEGDILLELMLADGAAVAVPLTRFLERWLPLLPPRGPIVLAVCNPHRARLRDLEGAAGRPVYYALGAVDSWLDAEPAREGAAAPPPDSFRLVAEAWRCVPGAAASRRSASPAAPPAQTHDQERTR